MEVNVCKPGLVVVPDVRWRVGSEFPEVNFVQSGVEGVELLLFFFTAFGGVVVNFPFESVFAEVIPVRFGVGKVQVPCLVYRVTWCYWGGRGAAQEEEFFVLFNNPERVLPVPAILAGKPL